MNRVCGRLARGIAPAVLRGVLVAVAAVLGAAGPVSADGWAKSHARAAVQIDLDSATQLIGLSLDGPNAGIVRQAARGGFDLSSGAQLDLSQWYSPRFPNLAAIFATDMGQGLSLIWGGSLGESGAKYSLGPSGIIGFALNRPIGHHGGLRLEVMGQIGGALQESACMGDYGALGGVQTVNCRLAASVLPPEQTLPYLWNIPAAVEGAVRLTYEFRF